LKNARSSVIVSRGLALGKEMATLNAPAGYVPGPIAPDTERLGAVGALTNVA
jgi:hypothetical protein